MRSQKRGVSEHMRAVFICRRDVEQERRRAEEHVYAYVCNIEFAINNNNVVVYLPVGVGATNGCEM